jgi:hypothetical protein
MGSRNFQSVDEASFVLKCLKSWRGQPLYSELHAVAIEHSKTMLHFECNISSSLERFIEGIVYGRRQLFEDLRSMAMNWTSVTPGTKVRMNESLKRELMGKCGEAGKHLGPFTEGEPGEPHSCFGCSWDHVKEFGECTGIVEGPVDYNVAGETFDIKKLGPELNVRWQPDGLRYAYRREDLEVLDKK